MGAPRILLVAPWGSPRHWQPVTYRLGQLTVKARTTLIPLLLSAARGRARALVIVADTLCADADNRGDIGSKWEQAEQAAREVAQKWLREFFEEYSLEGGRPLGEDRGPELLSSVKVAVCPGLGQYKVGGTTITFRGSLTLYYLCVLLSVLEEALEEAERQGGEMEIWLDLTHGVNYMPSVSLLAVLRARSVLEKLVGPTRLRLFNSDPPRGESKPVVVNEMELETYPTPLPRPDERVGNQKLCEVAAELLEKPQKLLRDDLREKARGALERARQAFEGMGRGVFEGLWYAASYALPLLALTYARKLPEGRAERSALELVRGLRDALFSALRSLNAEPDGGALTYPTGRAIVEEQVRILEVALEAYATCLGVARAAAAYPPDEEGGYALETIERFTSEVLSRYAPFAENFIGREVRELAATTWLTRPCNWTLYGELRKAVEKLKEPDEKTLTKLKERILVRYQGGSKPNYDDRNFRAHLGLVYSDVEVKLRAHA